MTIKTFLIITLGLLALSWSAQLVADERPTAMELLNKYIGPDAKKPKVFRYQGKDYLSRDLLYDFQATAFSDSLWQPSSAKIISIDILDFIFGKDSEEERIRSAKFYASPPFTKYILRDEGLPRIGVISKWTESVSIGLYLPWSYRYQYERVSKEQEDIMISIASEVVDQIRNVVDIKIEVIPPDKEKEVAEQPLGIRLIPQIMDTQRQSLKLKAGDEINGYSTSPFVFEKALVGAIPFTSHNARQVDGYLLTDHKNEIEIAICRFPTNVESHAIRDFITECVLRSLGLPNGVQNTDGAILGNWNSAQYTDHLGVTDYDLSMLSLLYCPAVKPGMDRHAALVALIEEKECVKSLLKDDYK